MQKHVIRIAADSRRSSILPITITTSSGTVVIKTALITGTTPSGTNELFVALPAPATLVVQSVDDKVSGSHPLQDFRFYTYFTNQK